MARVHAFIDGFNLYHRLKGIDGGQCRWLDLRKLVARFLEKEDELQKVVYFTAYFRGKPEAIPRHKVYIDALASVGVEKMLGRFQPVKRHCGLCGGHYKSHEEKKTDVQLSVQILRGAFRGEYDKLVLLTADSDQVPTLAELRDGFPSIHTKVLFPLGQKTDELSKHADTHHRLQEKHLRECQLPDLIESEGKRICRPDSWR